MSQTQYLFLSVFAILAYLILSDKSIAALFVLIPKFLRLQFERMKWMILYNPGNPIQKYLIWRNAMRIAKQLQKEQEVK